MKIRVRFEKQGPIRFIGHLDVMRYFQKVMRRADVAIRYSEGFSPHQIMSFALPLSVGLESRGEYMDIEVLETESSARMIERVNAVAAEGITVTGWRLLPDNAKNAMSQVAACDYSFAFREEARPEDETGFYREFISFCGRDSIPYVKKTKKGPKETDLRPLIYEAGLKEGRVYLKAAGGSSANLKPEQVLEAFYLSRGEEYPPFAFHIVREELYASEDPEGNKAFRPLEDYGEDIA